MISHLPLPPPCTTRTVAPISSPVRATLQTRNRMTVVIHPSSPPSNNSSSNSLASWPLPQPTPSTNSTLVESNRQHLVSLGPDLVHAQRSLQTAIASASGHPYPLRRLRNNLQTPPELPALPVHLPLSFPVVPTLSNLHTVSPAIMPGHTRLVLPLGASLPTPEINMVQKPVLRINSLVHLSVAPEVWALVNPRPPSMEAHPRIPAKLR